MKRYELTNTKPLAYEPDYRMVADEDGEYVLYDEAQARIEALEWLVEVQEFYMYRLRNPGAWSTPGMERAEIGVAWQRRSAANDELRAMYIAATEVKP